MSLNPASIDPVPDHTVRVARAAFPKGNPYLTLRDELGAIFQDDDFTDLYPVKGQPGLSPWRLALVTIMQFRETLADRQAAEAVRARIDWKYLLGLELTDPGFDFSVLSEFRDRLLAGDAQERLLDTLLERCRAIGLLKARGTQRTDATHVLSAVRRLNQLELVAETLRATLNELATVAPEWLQSVAPLEWYERYAKRIEDARLPKDNSEREAYGQTVGEDGFVLLSALESDEGLETLRELASVVTLRQLWGQYFERLPDVDTAQGVPSMGHVRLKPPGELPRAAAHIESPYDLDARYRKKRSTQWSGYMLHISETCDDTEPHLLTHVHTTPATVHEAQCTEPIHQALTDKDALPETHLVDAAYVSAQLLLSSQQDYGVDLMGPARPNPNWQAQVEGAYSIEHFTIDWERQQVTCPQGQVSSSWTPLPQGDGSTKLSAKFRRQDCQDCLERARCTRAKTMPRMLNFHPQAQYEALQRARARFMSEAGQELYKRRAGVEGTISQGVRAFGMRRSRYRGLNKTHLQDVATAAAINMDRLVAWFDGRPLSKTRTSRFAALSPEHAYGPG